jgi:glycosyltransferase involved in cell wall biosynthesis
MRAAAASDARVATVSVMANSATILSIPERNEPTDGLPEGISLDEAAERVNQSSLRIRPEIPTAVGHCMLIRRSALELVGPFDLIFSPGYGEEVDFSQRCLVAGLKHVLADDVYVLHHGGVSFGERSKQLQHDRDTIVANRYPWFLETVHQMQVRTEGPLDSALLNASIGLRRWRVTIDGAGLNASRTGTQLHTLGVISSLARSGQVDLRVLVPTPLNAEVAKLLAGFDSVELLPDDEVDEETEKSDLVHRPFQFTNPSELQFLQRLGHRLVVSQLDQIAFHNASYFESATAWFEYRQTTIDALANIDLALFISQHSADDAIANGLIDADRAAVIHLGVEQLMASPDEPPVAPSRIEQLAGAPFVLCLGTNFSHKNRVFAIRLLAALRELGWDGWLVFAGPHAASGTSEDAEQAELDADPGNAARVVDLGPVEEAEKLWLLANTAAVIYPTTHEGFGLVPFEAAAAGAPCIFASNTSLAELFPKELAMITAWDEKETARATLPLLTAGPEREQQVSAVLAAGAALTWPAYGASLLDAYRAMLELPSSAYSLLTRQGQGAVSREGYWLVGPEGLLDQRYERPLLAISSRPALALILLRPLEWCYRLMYKIIRLPRLGKGASDREQGDQPAGRSTDKR